MMVLIKHIHVMCALLSISGFIGRGILMMRASPLLEQRWLRIAPHINDSLFLLSAITLAVYYNVSPLSAPWLGTKVVALLIYISLGEVALRLKGPRWLQMTAWLAAVVVFIYIVGVAVTKSPTW